MGGVLFFRAGLVDAEWEPFASCVKTFAGVYWGLFEGAASEAVTSVGISGRRISEELPV